MALRLYTKAEFESELRNKHGLTPTEIVTGTTKLWKNKAGKHVSIPMKGIDIPEQGEKFPDDWMAAIYKELERLA